MFGVGAILSQWLFRSSTVRIKVCVIVALLSALKVT